MTVTRIFLFFTFSYLFWRPVPLSVAVFRAGEAAGAVYPRVPANRRSQTALSSSRLVVTWPCSPGTPACPRTASPGPASGPGWSSSRSPGRARGSHRTGSGQRQSWTSPSSSCGRGRGWWRLGGGEGTSSHCLGIVCGRGLCPPQWPAGSHWSHGSWDSCSLARTAGIVHHCWRPRSPRRLRTVCPVWREAVWPSGGRSHRGVGGSDLLSAEGRTTCPGQSGSCPRHHVRGQGGGDSGGGPG